MLISVEFLIFEKWKIVYDILFQYAIRTDLDSGLLIWTGLIWFKQIMAFISILMDSDYQYRYRLGAHH